MSESGIKVRTAPNSKESEMMVLGCMLTSINAMNIAADALDDSDFYYTEHKIIFEVLKSAYKEDRAADVHLVCEELKRQDRLKAVGGAAYVTTLAQYAGTSAYIEEYTQLVKDKAILRRMIHAAQTVEKNALNEPEDVLITLDDAQKMFFQISQTINSSIGKLIKDILSGVKAETATPFLKELQARQERFQQLGPEETGITGLPTHFTDLDKMINGLGNSNLIILAARPAMGKTAFALNIAENACFKSNVPVGIFSLEMSAEQLVHRLVCSHAEVESDKIRTGNLNGIEFQRIVASVNQMQSHTMIIDDQAGLKITDLRARARRMKESYNIGLLIVDYLQLLSGANSARSNENRQGEISEISRNLKNLARELNIPVICLSQLSRKVEERQGHRPMMSDLRESGCLTGDTKIQDCQTGKMYTIKELAERTNQTPIFVNAIDKNLKIGSHRLIKAFYSGKKQTYRLTTRTGRTIQASGNHPFLKLEGWTPLESLVVGQKIGLPRNCVPNKKNATMTDEELILLAHLLGDGCILENQPYHYTSADQENIDAVSKSAKVLFDIEAKVVPQKSWFHVYLPSPYHLTHNKKHPITNWFASLGIDRVRSYEKKIPEALFEASRDQISLFLKHLWSTDGNISEKKMKGRKSSVAIYYASSSEFLSKQVQSLLLRVDIQSTLRKSPSAKGYRDMYHVVVSGKTYQEQFLQSIGAIGKRGENTPTYLKHLELIKENLNYDVIPREAWQTVVKEAKQANALTWRQIASGLNMSYCGSTLFKSGISRNRAGALLEICPHPTLQNLQQSDVYWDEIISIESLSVEDVYDATVEGVHNFVANDIIVHNSIEQDSDIVMFLLRREYYDPNDKPGLAEVIIAKNRHGGVGTVNMTFRKEIGQFANYSPIKFDGAPSPVANEEAFSHFS